ncbi:hypothetical protein RhoFasB10_02941 [Rhodococcus sp. B10]|nr:hypothetical protein [Rhodococcus sp. B10]
MKPKRLTECTDRAIPTRRTGPRHSGNTESQYGGVMPGTLTSPQLTAADRCDRCGAGARARVVLSTGGELLFCNHHAKEHEDRLREMNATVMTETDSAV